MGAGSYVSGAIGPRESLRRVQGPQEVAEHSGEAALVKEVRRVVVGDGRAIALHRLDLNDPLKEDRIQRPR